MSNEQVRSYDRVRSGGGAPRETEGRALLESARRLAEAQQRPEQREELRTAARLNWRLWTIFQAELSAPDCPLSPEIRTNMLNLCNFVDKRTVALLARPEPAMADVLININRQIAAGLLTTPEAAKDAEDRDGAAAPPDGPKSGGISI